MSERVAVSPCPVEHMVNQACVPTDRGALRSYMPVVRRWQKSALLQDKKPVGRSSRVSDGGKSPASDRRWSSPVHRGCLGRDIQTPTLHIKPGLV